jgi:hypothetical protein
MSLSVVLSRPGDVCPGGPELRFAEGSLRGRLSALKITWIFISTALVGTASQISQQLTRFTGKDHQWSFVYSLVRGSSSVIVFSYSLQYALY